MSPRGKHAAPRGRNVSPFVVLMVVLSATFMQLLDVSIVNVATQSIKESLHATYSDVQLVLAGYQLAFACTLITGGRLGDIFGRRRLFLIGMFGFTLSSALCGAAVNSQMLIGSRVLQGLCSGMMFPQVLSVIQVIFPPQERGKAFGIFGATIGLGTILGPLAGGVLIQAHLFSAAWRSIFYVNVPIGIVAFIGALVLLPESTAPQAARLDLPGALLVALGLGCLVYPLTEGRNKGWPLTLDLMLLASVPLLAGFYFLQRSKTRRNSAPLLDTGLFSDKAFRYGALLSLVFFAGVPPFFFTFSLFLQVGHGFSALGAGLTSFSFAIGSGFASAASDRVTKQLGRRVLSLGSAVLVVGMLLVILTIHLTGSSPHTYDFAPALLVCGVGLGLFVAPVNNLILAGVTPARIGGASGAISTVQQIGGAIGVAVIGLVFFGFIGGNAAGAARDTRPGLERQLVAAGLPRPAVAPVTAGFAACYVSKAQAADPDQQTAACRKVQQTRTPGLSPATGRKVAGVLQTAAVPGSSVQRSDYVRSMQQSLLYEVVVFAIAGFLVLLLPRGAPGQGRPAAGD